MDYVIIGKDKNHLEYSNGFYKPVINERGVSIPDRLLGLQKVTTERNVKGSCWKLLYEKETKYKIYPSSFEAIDVYNDMYGVKISGGPFGDMTELVSLFETNAQYADISLKLKGETNIIKRTILKIKQQYYKLKYGYNY